MITQEVIDKISSSVKNNYLSSEGFRLREAVSRRMSNSIHITNGIENRRINISEGVPLGWKKGVTRIKSENYGHLQSHGTKQLLRNIVSNTICITNGVINKKIKKYDEIPQGWERGRLNFKVTDWKTITKKSSITRNQRMIEKRAVA